MNELNHKVDVMALNRLKVFDEHGRELIFSSFWKSKQVTVIFVRHFGCIDCRAHVDKIWNKREDLLKTSNIIFVGNGKPEVIKMFKDDIKSPSAPVFTDPTLEVFDACGLKRSSLNLIDPRGIKRMFDLMNEGYSQGPIDKRSGFHTQMGGVVVFKPHGKVVYHFVSDYLGDFDKPEDWPAY